SFASPDTIDIWRLPGFIAVLEEAGFSAVRHRLHFQSLLALPVLAMAMALLAAGFSMRSSRRGGVAQMVGAGVAAGCILVGGFLAWLVVLTDVPARRALWFLAALPFMIPSFAAALA
ncbi:LptF/LptG family permease, partial [Escherichia coli]|nr:LptF/LptG family permease [Escherichia coli]